jgi:limonene-1,2-epoxide hydrolase
MSDAVQATARRLLALVQEGDIAGKRALLGECFAEDAAYHVQVPDKAQVKGREAIVDELAGQTAHYSALECEFVTVVSGGRTVVMERIDHLTLPQGGPRVANELVAIFEGDGAGRITAWREYWDSVALGQRMQAALSTGTERSDE